MLNTLRADERGFTMVTLMGVMLVVVSLVFVTYSAADGDLAPGKQDESRKVAYAAAEAGVQNYLFHLTQNDDYWAKCTTVTAPNAVNQKFAGAIPAGANRLKVPDSPASYVIELLPAPGKASCIPGDTSSMIDTATGTFRIRATGFSRDVNPVKRSIIATFKRKSFLEYIYFTDYESSDPQLYKLSAVRDSTSGLTTKEDPRPSPLLQRNIVDWAAQECGTTHWWEGRGALPGFRGQQVNSAGIDSGGWKDFGPVPCAEIQFIGPSSATSGSSAPTSSDRDVVNGPLHTNDTLLICGHPRFGRAPTDKIEVAGDPGWRGNGSCGSDSAPNVNVPPAAAPKLGTWMKNSAALTLPPSNAQLRTDALPAFRFEGRTKIVLDNDHMYVWGKREGDASPLINQHILLPANGALYVSNAAGCGSTYEPLKTYQSPDPQPTDLSTGWGTGCGNIDIRGTYSVSLTIGAANDVVITENVLKSGGMGNAPDVLFGLIADGFIRVYHPVTNRSVSSGGSNRCDNNGGPAQDIQIDAAMLTIGHSFVHDNYFCGETTGTLRVNGAIGQKYRGPVGTSSGGVPVTGFKKDYVYDDRLKFRSPPHFIDPVDAGWGVQLYTEQTPAK